MNKYKLEIQAHIYWWILGSLIYFLWYHFVVGIRPEHYYGYIILSSIFIFWTTGRKFLTGLTGILLYIVAYDSLRVYPNHSFFEIRTSDVYFFEKELFGIIANNTKITLNEYFAQHYYTWMDIFSGFAYLTWIPVPISIAIYLFIKNKRHMVIFTTAFALTNLIGVTIYYLIPTAPPWYIAKFGFIADTSTMGHTAGLGRFDSFFGVEIFKNMFTKNSSVFAAIPSMHAADPFVSFLILAHLKYQKLAFLMFLNSFLIWISVVYSGHHYVIDVLAGIGVGFAGFYLMKGLLMTRWFKSLFEKQVSSIS